MVWHEIVNEEFAGEKVSITYCPLTGSAIAYLGEFLESETTFGTSGKLVNSNLIMYDRETESYWPQIYGRAITGEMSGEKLERVPLYWTQWQLVKDNFPEANILSRDTGFSRNYNRDPYGSYIENGSSGNYYTNDRLVFNVINEDNRLERKDIVIAGEINETPFAINKDLIKENQEISFIIDNSFELVNFVLIMFESSSIRSFKFSSNTLFGNFLYFFLTWGIFPSLQLQIRSLIERILIIWVKSSCKSV